MADLLDSIMESFDVRETHEIAVAASRERVWAALHEVSLREAPVFRWLIAVRELPAMLVGARWLTRELDRPILEAMTAVGFVPLGERAPNDVVIGLLARPWRGEVRAVDAASFAAFDVPGWTKITLGFRLGDAERGTRLRTETRVRCTDASARRWFRAYWLAVGWASGATRRAWLRAIKRRAEGAQSRVGAGIPG